MLRLEQCPEFQELKEKLKTEVYESQNKDMSPQDCGFLAGIKSVIEYPERIIKEFKGEN